MGYRLWGFIRRFLVQTGIFFEKILWTLTGGKHPANLFSYRAKPEFVGTTVKVLSEDENGFEIAKFKENGEIDDGEFRILTSTDFHFEPDADGNAKTVELFCRQIRDTKPDLIILTGDIILGKYQQVDAVKFAQMMDKMGIYWCYVFGNHETREEKGFYKWLIYHSLSKGKYSLCKFGPGNIFGYGNFNIRIMNSKKEVREVLFMFDSGRNIRPEYTEEYGLAQNAEGYDFLKNSQIDFYKKTLDGIHQDAVVPSMMYMHIPLMEYQNAFTKNDDGTYTRSGIARILYGTQFESVGCSTYNSGMFDAILQKGSTKAVFAGHDHVNDWCALYEGVYLVYSLPASYNPYHMGTNFNVPEEDWKQGVTITDIHQDGSLTIHPEYNRKYLTEDDK